MILERETKHKQADTLSTQFTCDQFPRSFNERLICPIDERAVRTGARHSLASSLMSSSRDMRMNVAIECMPTAPVE